MLLPDAGHTSKGFLRKQPKNQSIRGCNCLWHAPWKTPVNSTVVLSLLLMLTQPSWPGCFLADLMWLAKRGKRFVANFWFDDLSDCWMKPSHASFVFCSKMNCGQALQVVFFERKLASVVNGTFRTASTRDAGGGRDK